MIILKFIPDKDLRREIEAIMAESGMFDDFQGLIRFHDRESVRLEGDFTQAQLILLTRLLEMFDIR